MKIKEKCTYPDWEGNITYEQHKKENFNKDGYCRICGFKLEFKPSSYQNSYFRYMYWSGNCLIQLEINRELGIGIVTNNDKFLMKINLNQIKKHPNAQGKGVCDAIKIIAEQKLIKLL